MVLSTSQRQLSLSRDYALCRQRNSRFPRFFLTISRKGFHKKEFREEKNNEGKAIFLEGVRKKQLFNYNVNTYHILTIKDPYTV